MPIKTGRYENTISSLAEADLRPHGDPGDASQASFVKVSVMPRFQRHIFVCINEREAGSEKGCCASKGGKAVRDEFKKQLARKGLLGEVRANKAGCLDECEYGVAVVIYPEQIWYRGVRVEDVTEIVQSHILEGKYVERLRIESDLRQEQESLLPLRLPIIGQK